MTLQHHIYTVVKGDTLIKIAHRFKTTPTALMAANNISDPSKLSIGKKLKIPSKESRSAANSVPAVVPSVPSQPAQVQAQPAAPTGQLANFLQ
jgi:LysM repeat protein